ncbi:MAG: DUF4173 domain-containing protein [Actinobacteria bacterium]|nr:DUF4173 domain-containing protein [Actinomycetota bacterium]
MRALALVTAALAAALIPGAAPGIGVTVVVLLATAALTVGRRPTVDLVLFGGLAAALGLLPAFRDNGTLIALDLLGVFCLLAFALCGPSLLAPLRPLAALPKVPALVPAPSGTALGLGRGLILAVAVAVPFVALFWSADAAFAKIVGATPFPDGASLPLRAMTFLGVLGAVLAVGLAPLHPVRPEPLGIRRRLAPSEWIPTLTVLVAVFALFVGIQLTVLFGGRDHVLGTEGLTFAAYARSGYWQLLAVAALTFVVVGLATVLAEVPTVRLRRLRRALLGLLVAMTLVVLASALHRLRLYQEALGFTPLRLYVEASLYWFAALFVLVLGAGAVRSCPATAAAGGAGCDRNRAARLLDREPGRAGGPSQRRAVAGDGPDRRRHAEPSLDGRGPRARGATVGAARRRSPPDPGAHRSRWSARLESLAEPGSCLRGRRPVGR